MTPLDVQESRNFLSAETLEFDFPNVRFLREGNRGPQRHGNLSGPPGQWGEEPEAPGTQFPIPFGALCLEPQLPNQTDFFSHIRTLF